MSNLLRLFTKDDCSHCDAMKNKLTTWGIRFETINISEDIESKYFLKKKMDTEQFHNFILEIIMLIMVIPKISLTQILCVVCVVHTQCRTLV